MPTSSDGRIPVYDSYARLSRVPETGELEKIETQHEDNAAAIERRGGIVGETLDDGLSAWKPGVRRPGWEKLLERIQAEVVDGLCVWHLDRLFRKPGDLARLVELAKAGFKIMSAHGTRDISNPDDLFILWIEVAHAARSSADTSRRIKRRFEKFRSQGRIAGGMRRLGFGGWDLHARGENGERVPVAESVVEHERAMLRDAAYAMLAGASQTDITKKWNEAGFYQVTGKPWIPATVAATMRRESLGGHIVHEGVIVGRLEGDPILDTDTYDRLQALFKGRKRGRQAGKVGRRYVGTGILRCVCGVKMSAHAQGPKKYRDGTTRASYYCATARRGCGKVYADVARVDHELMLFTAKRLSNPGWAAAIASARAQVCEELDHVEKELTACRELQEALANKLGRRKMTLAQWEAASEPLDEQITKLDKRRAQLSGGAGEGEPIKPESKAVLMRRWLGGTPDIRRGMLTQALERSQVVIFPNSKPGKRVFDRDRVRVIPPEDATPAAATPESIGEPETAIGEPGDAAPGRLTPPSDATGPLPAWERPRGVRCRG